jgi:hypothetical protein
MMEAGEIICNILGLYFYSIGVFQFTPSQAFAACFNDESTLSLSVPGKIDIQKLQKLQKESFIEDKAAEKFLRYP